MIDWGEDANEFERINPFILHQEAELEAMLHEQKSLSKDMGLILKGTKNAMDLDYSHVSK